MPQKRGEIIGYDAERMVYEFTMINDFDAIDCEISNAALNVLARGWENDRLPDRDGKFSNVSRFDRAGGCAPIRIRWRQPGADIRQAFSPR